MRSLELVDSIPGWLRPEDADKLYELAHSTEGPILDVGTYHGKSATLMALAARDAGRGAFLYTIDVDRAAVNEARAQAKAHGVADRIVFVRGTLAAFALAYPHIRPAVTFIDGDHTQAGVTRDLDVLKQIVPVAGRLLFHDFHDPPNDEPNRNEMRVRSAVETSWVAEQCDFVGSFGCCGLFTRKHGAPLGDVPAADLLRLDSVREQYLHRLRYPAGRAWKRLRGQHPGEQP